MSEEHASKQVVLGFFLGIALQIMFLPIVFGLAVLAQGRHRTIVPDLASWALFGFGVTQILYMLPAILIARRKGRFGIAKGLIILAALAFLLNASCFVALWSGKFGRIGG
jgi:hypothetical protein